MIRAGFICTPYPRPFSTRASSAEGYPFLPCYERATNGLWRIDPQIPSGHCWARWKTGGLWRAVQGPAKISGHVNHDISRVFISSTPHLLLCSDRNPEGLPELRPTPTQKLLSTTVKTSWFPKTLEPGSVPPSSRDGGVMRDPIQGAIRQGQRTSDRWLDSDTIPRTPPVMDASIFRVGDLSVLRMCVLEILVRATYAG